MFLSLLSHLCSSSLESASGESSASTLFIIDRNADETDKTDHTDGIRSIRKISVIRVAKLFNRIVAAQECDLPAGR
jgi:hypothetical protein